MASFAGRWIREFHLQRQPWVIGRIEQVNVRGRSSHEDPPLLLAGSTGFGEESGRVWAIHLGWSGNHEMRADRTADGFAYLQAAEHLHPGEIVLRPGESYVTPTVYAVASDRGLNGVSDAFHAHVRARPVHPSTPRPVTLNTWEAVYFDHDPHRLTALADAAAEVGIERFVLDDGWFRGRRDDTAGLGDWYVDPQVHPDGLAPLAGHVRDRDAVRPVGRTRDGQPRLATVPSRSVRRPDPTQWADHAPSTRARSSPARILPPTFANG